MKKKNAKQKFVDHVTPFPTSHSGAKSRLDSMQGRPKGADKEALSENQKEGKILPVGSEKCNVCDTTASKYNGGPFDIDGSKYLIGIDWLEMTLKGQLPINPESDDITFEGFTFLNQEKGTTHFQCKFNVYYDLRILGELQIFPRSTILDEEQMMLKLENINFYNGLDLERVIKKFIKVFSLSFNNISRVDVFLDSFGFQSGMPLNELEYLLNSGKIVTNTKVKYNSSHSFRRDGTFIKTGFSWGSRGSGRYLRIYNKTLEIEENKKSNKDYIRQWHIANGLSAGNVFRFEYELKAAWLNKLIEFQWQDVFDGNGQLRLLLTAVKNHFSFVWEDGKSRNDRKKPVELFDWNKISQNVETPFTLKTRTQTSQISPATIKRDIRSNFRQYIFQGQMRFFMDAICYYLWYYDNAGTTHEFRNWWDKKKLHYLSEFLKERSILYPFDKLKMDAHEQGGLRRVIESQNKPKGKEVNLFY